MDEPKTRPAPWQRAMWPLLPVGTFAPPAATVGVEIAGDCHPGKLKPYNEDNYLVIHLGRSQEVVSSSLASLELPEPFEEHAYIMIVADGIGGAGTGSVASRLALSTVAQLSLHYGKWSLRIDPEVADDIMKRMEFFYKRVQEAVTSHSMTDRGLSTMAASVTAAYSVGHDLFVAHVGHCRAYICREGTLIALTSDHTLAAKGYTGPAEVEHITDDLQHILTHAIGGSFTGPGVEIEHFRLMHGDCLLLCTNGLTDLVEEFRIADVLIGRRKLAEQCQALIDLALEAGGTDNITVILAQYALPQSDGDSASRASRAP
jgi:protein phosphatase